MVLIFFTKGYNLKQRIYYQQIEKETQLVRISLRAKRQS